MSILGLMFISMLAVATEQAHSSVYIASRDTTHVVLDQPEADAVISQIRAFFASCSFNSVDHPDVFGKQSPAADWDAVARQPRLYARLSGTVTTLGGHRNVALTE